MITINYGQAHTHSKSSITPAALKEHGKIITYTVGDDCQSIEKVADGYKVDKYNSLNGFSTVTHTSLAKAKAKMTVNCSRMTW